MNIAWWHRFSAPTGDALAYARAALANYQQAGPGATTDAAEAEQLVAALEQRNR
jgi:hypothetical protein